jgi:multidrug transporter EmrE-like cation transporter
MIRGALLLILYAALVTASNALVKLSAEAAWFWPFILPFAAGNVAGLGGVLIYSLMLKRMPLHIAFPLTRGFGVLGVQLAASLLLFHEALRPTEVAGAVMVTAGIILTGLAGGRAKPAAAECGERRP